MAIHSSTLTWNIPWTEEPGRLQSMGSWRVRYDSWLHFHFSLSRTGEGNDNPLQCSCLEDPRDGAAWWAAIYGVAQSQTQLKQLSSSSRQWMTMQPAPKINLRHWISNELPWWMIFRMCCHNSADEITCVLCDSSRKRLLEAWVWFPPDFIHCTFSLCWFCFVFFPWNKS